MVCYHQSNPGMALQKVHILFALILFPAAGSICQLAWLATRDFPLFGIADLIVTGFS